MSSKRIFFQEKWFLSVSLFMMACFQPLSAQPSWTEASNISMLNGVAWDGGQFIGCGWEKVVTGPDTTFPGVLYTSPDGQAWTERYCNNAHLAFINDIACNTSIRVAVGRTGKIYTSTNGLAWSMASVPVGPNIHFYGAAWIGTQFLALGHNDLNGIGQVYSSADGTNWATDSCTIPTQLNGAVGFVNCEYQQMYTVIGKSGTYRGWYVGSPSGSGWWLNHYDNVGSSVDLNGITIIPAETLLVVVGDSGAIYTSHASCMVASLTWIKQTSNTTNDLYGVTWTGTQLIAVGDHETILTSPNGINWTKQTFQPTFTFYDVAFNNTRAVAVGNYVYYSSNLNINRLAQEQNSNPFLFTCKPDFSIGFSIPADAMVRLAVYTIDGRKEATILENILKKGNHAINLKPYGLDNGMHIVSLQVNDQKILVKAFMVH